MIRKVSIDKVLKPLAEIECQAYLNNSMQVADLLEWIIRQTGVAEVWMTSFSISEEFLRRLYFISKGGIISRLHLVLDHKATMKTIKLWSFISQVVDRTYLADNHSKILLVRSMSGYTVSVVTSQNLTRGNRTESTVISTNPDIFTGLLRQVNDLITYHSVPIDDLFRQRLGND